MSEQTTHQKVALITGANKGIGRAAAEQLAALGMTVLIGARDPRRGEEAAAAVRAAGGDAHAVTLDVTDPTTVREAAKQVEERFGHLDAADQQRRHHRLRADLARRRLRSGPQHRRPGHGPGGVRDHVFGVIAVTNALLPLLRRSPAPRIVNVSSHAASLTIFSDPDGPMATLLPSAAYSPSKTALSALTVQYANELRKSGILVNAAAPGFVDTDSNNHSGHLTVAEGAAILVRLATLGADGSTGGFFSEQGSVPW